MSLRRFVYNEKKGCYERGNIDVPVAVEIETESVVDLSQWKPDLGTVANMLGGSNRIPLYDYEDGKDTGLNLAYLRDPARDITEIEAMRAAYQSSVNKNLQEIDLILQAQKAEKEAQKQIDDYKSNNNNASVSASADSSDS